MFFEKQDLFTLLALVDLVHCTVILCSTNLITTELFDNFRLVDKQLF